MREKGSTWMRLALLLAMTAGLILPVQSGSSSDDVPRIGPEEQKATPTGAVIQAEPGWLEVLHVTLVADQADDIVLDANEDYVFVTGHTDGDLDGQTNAGHSDIFLTKYDRHGAKQWTKLIGTSSPDYGTGLALAPGGDLYMAGYTQGDLNGETKTVSQWDAFISRYGADGTHRWTRLLGVEADAQPPIYDAKVAVDGSGNACLVASAKVTVGGQPYMVVAKYSSSGVKQWLHGVADDAWGGSGDVAADASGNVYITGWTDGDVGGDTNAGWWDILVAKYNSGGVQQWAHLLGSPGQDYGLGIDLDAAGANAYVTGYAAGDVDGKTNAGKDDLFLAKYNSAGARQWTRLEGTAEFDEGHDVTVADNGRIYVTGQTFGALNGEKHAGEFDVLVSQFDSNGNRKWTILNGTVENDKGRGIVVDGGGYPFVAGLSEGDWDGTILKGDYDGFTWKVGEMRARAIIENFDDGQAVAWQDDGSGRWAVAMVPVSLNTAAADNGVYQMVGDLGHKSRYTHYQDQFGELTYQADMRKVAGDSEQYKNAYGLRFRSDASGDNFYAFYITQTGSYWIGKRVGGNFTALVNWTKSPALQAGFGNWNTLKVEAQGDLLRFSANDTVLHTLKDPSHANGYAGLSAFDANDSDTADSVQFDNVTMLAEAEVKVQVLIPVVVRNW